MEKRPKKRICVIGSKGYLAGQVIDRLRNSSDVELVLGIDNQYSQTVFVEQRQGEALVTYHKLDMTSPYLGTRLRVCRINSCLHLGWWFNPTHRVSEQWKVNVEGTQNVIRACLESGTVKHLFYGGSSTAYGQLDDPREEALAEADWQRDISARMNAAYPYAKQKARADWDFQYLQGYVSRSRPDFREGWMRGAIVAGKNTRNVVTDVAKAFGPVMFRARGRDPLMQFISERDMAEVLYRAMMEEWTGPVNVAGTGTLRYSKVIELLGKKEISFLPFPVLYALCWLGWNLRIGDRSLVPFPPSILHLVSKSWVGKIDRLVNEYGYKPQNSSTDAIIELSEGLRAKI